MEWLNPYHLQVGSFVLINAILGVSIYVTLSTGQLSLGNAGFMSVGAYAAALLSTQHQVPIPAGILAGSLLAGAAGFLILLLCTILTVAFFLRLSRSRVGRAYAAIRLDERAAEAAGIPITYYKVLAFSQGALLSGFAGALFAHSTSFVSPGDFTYHRAVEILVFAVFGGSEHI